MRGHNTLRTRAAIMHGRRIQCGLAGEDSDLDKPRPAAADGRGRVHCVAQYEQIRQIVSLVS